MAFEGLSEKLNATFKHLRGKGRLSEEDIKLAMREVRLALLEADVSYKVVKDFVKTVSERAVGAEVLDSLTPAQQVIKIVSEELTALMGGANAKLTFASRPPTVVMMVGLQGAGKTTNVAKLAGYLRKQGHCPLLTACDVYRPAAITQLQVVGKQLNIPVFEMGQIDPVTIAQEAVKYAGDHGNDIVFLDTAGRLHIDEALMDELRRVKAAVKPTEILLVVDAMTGQDAVNAATAFDEALGIDGVVLTKLDGDARGGAALSFALLVPALFVFFLQRWWVSRKSYVTVSGKSGAQTRPKGIGLAAEAAILGVCAVVIAFIVFLYALITMGAFTKTWGLDNSFTLDSFAYVFNHGRKAIIDTLIIACVSTPLGGLIAVLVAYITQRKSFPCNALMEIVSLLNFALPGTVVGIAYIIAFNSSPLILTGTMSILVAAYVFRYDSAGIRSVIASLQQIDTSLEEASLSLGASSAATFRNVTLPLVVPALLAGMKYLFIHSMTAISATIFLVSVSWSLLTARILECMTELQFGNACAFSVVLILLVFLFNGLLTLLVRAAGFGYRGQGGNR